MAPPRRVRFSSTLAAQAFTHLLPAFVKATLESDEAKGSPYMLALLSAGDHEPGNPVVEMASLFAAALNTNLSPMTEIGHRLPDGIPLAFDVHVAPWSEDDLSAPLLHDATTY